MDFLFWTPPWPMRSGNFHFLKSAFEKHLLVQAVTLAKQGHNVSVVVPSAYSQIDLKKYSKLNFLELSSLKSIQMLGSANDPSLDFYQNGCSGKFGKRVLEWLRPQLPEDIDAILLFENPVPFLEEIYPDALIIHQMPGAFSRPPYPHTIQFDPRGLFKASALYQVLESNQTSNRPCESGGAVDAFSLMCRNALRASTFPLDPKLRGDVGEGQKYLLPLQISDHYAFKADTGFDNQVSLIQAALDSIEPDDSLVITEYATGPYSEPVLTPELQNILRVEHRHIVFDPKARNVNSVSQHILPRVDGVITASSSLAVQACAWDHEIKVVADTHLSPFGSSKMHCADNRRKALGYILSRNQPLSDAITHDGTFLSGLIEEMHVRRNMSAAEASPEFSDIDPDYWTRLEDSFRPARVDAALRPKNTPQKRVEKFREVLAEQKPKLVSFDLFDTLIKRPVENPADVYFLLERRLKLEGIEVRANFADHRLAAELEARENIERDEITLAEIYAQPSLSELDETQAERAMAEEMALELDAASPREVGAEFYQAAREHSCEICITSDMYLPESVISGMLEKTGYGDTRLFLSSTVGVTKKSGGLFKHILQETGYKAGDLLHVGDTYKSDIQPAERLGISSFHIPKSVDYLRDNKNYGNAFVRRHPIEAPDRSLVVGAISHKLYDDPNLRPTDSMFNGDPRNFGYAALGPLLLGFSTWLREQASLRGLTHLHFLSREGRILKDAFDIVDRDGASGIQTSYLFGSRRAIRVANIKVEDDVHEMARTTIDAGAKIGDLLFGRFGVTQEELPDDALQNAGYASWESPVGSRRVQRQRFIELMREIAPLVVEKSIKERELYLSYLADRGLSESAKFGIVDIGWQANMQGALGTLIGHEFPGFYLASLSQARKWAAQGHSIHGYLADFADDPTQSSITDYRLLVEHIFCDTTPSIIGVQREGSGFAPRYQAEDNTLLRERHISPIHSAALSFVKDVCAETKSFDYELKLPPEFACRMFEEFLANPSRKDTALFENHRIDDAFGGVGKRYYLRHKDRIVDERASYWTAGAKALVKKSATKTKEKPTVVSQRQNAVLSLAWPVLKTHLSDREQNLFANDPQELFGKARHPVMVFVGRAAGII